MKSKITITFIAGFLIVLVFTMGMVLGVYRGYEKGYQEGKRNTNSWWIDKQSRYYDSDEVDSKRRHHLFDYL